MTKAKVETMPEAMPKTEEVIPKTEEVTPLKLQDIQERNNKIRSLAVQYNIEDSLRDYFIIRSKTIEEAEVAFKIKSETGYYEVSQILHAWGIKPEGWGMKF